MTFVAPHLLFMDARKYVSWNDFLLTRSKLSEGPVGRTQFKDQSLLPPKQAGESG